MEGFEPSSFIPKTNILTIETTSLKNAKNFYNLLRFFNFIPLCAFGVIFKARNIINL